MSVSRSLIVTLVSLFYVSCTSVYYECTFTSSLTKWMSSSIGQEIKQHCTKFNTFKPKKSRHLLILITHTNYYLSLSILTLLLFVRPSNNVVCSHESLFTFIIESVPIFSPYNIFFLDRIYVFLIYSLIFLNF